MLKVDVQFDSSELSTIEPSTVENILTSSKLSTADMLKVVHSLSSSELSTFNLSTVDNIL